VAGAVGSLTITVSWSPVPFATGYTIERARVDNLAPGALPVYAAWTTVNGTTTSRDNTGLTAGRAYQYRVRANNALGSSAFIETVAATVQ
jgi:hypothetical protein